MAYDEIYLNGVRPSWVEADIEVDKENHTIRVKCMAKYDRLGADPQSEIDQFNEMASGVIENRFPMANGGSKLFAEKIFSVTVNNKTYEKCALHPITTVIDSRYRGARPGSVLQYELSLEYEVDGRGGSVVYTPEYGKDEYSGELEYHHGYDPFSGAYWNYTDRLKGTEIGMCKFTMEKNVKRVEIYGNGDVNGSYLECNKTGRFYWPVGYLEQEGDYAPQQMGFGWDLDTKLTVSRDADAGDTTVLVNPVRGGILDNTVLTLESGTGPDTIIINGDMPDKATTLIVDALTDDVIAGAVYGIDRRVVLVTSSPHLPDEAQFVVGAGGASIGATSIPVIDPGFAIPSGRVLKRLSGTGPFNMVVDGDYIGGPTIIVEPITENVHSSAVYTMRLNMGTNMAYIRLVYE